jgi:CBS domain containing-hemolysin-like protein
MMDVALLIVAILLCLAVSFFYSGSETAIISVNKYRLRGLREQGDAASGRVLSLLANTPRLLLVVLICNNLVNVLMALFAKAAVERGWPELTQRRALDVVPWSDLAGILILTPVLVVFGEILPKMLFRANADRFIYGIRPLMIASDLALRPIVLAMERFTSIVLSPIIEQRTRALRNLTRKDVLDLISPEDKPEERAEETTEADETVSPIGRHAVEAAAGEEAPWQESADERRMVQNIIQLQETMARDIMTPLVELVAVPLGRTDMEGFKNLARRSGFSRYPVYPDRIVNLIGYIDLYRVLHDTRPEAKLEDFVETPHYVPETKRVDDLLQEFLKLRINNAIVVDEYGGCLGWISREDILEEIVGELEDELDEPLRRIQESADGSWLIEGRVEIDDVNDALGTDFPDEDWDTVGGLVLAAMGRIPKEGDSVLVEGGWRATVVAMERHRIALVRLAPEKQAGKDP